MIIAGSSHPKLAEAIAFKLSMPFILNNTKKFEDHELCVEIKGDIDGKNVFIVQSTSNPANDHLIELLLLVDAARRAGAKVIAALIPYFGYSRQDSACKGAPISAYVVASMLNAAGIDEVITMDLHSESTGEFFKMKVTNLEVFSLFAKFFDNQDNIIVISPDRGGHNRAKRFAHLLGVKFIVLNKMRLPNNDCVTEGPIEEVVGKNCIIIDDIIDTGGTLCSAAELLIKQGALSVTACITHAVLSAPVIKKLASAPITKLYITDSINHAELGIDIHVVEAANIFAEALLHTNIIA